MTRHSLDDASHRLERASEHLAEFEKAQDAFGREYHDNLIIELGDENRPIFREGKPLVIDSRAPILIGEAIYNLRAALDYLVYELAILDSGKAQEFTQFPICDTSEKFKANCSRNLVGLSEKHCALIEKLQPYNGGNSLARLRDISNPDKHRRLVSPDHSFAISASTFQNATARLVGLEFIKAHRSQRPVKWSDGSERIYHLTTHAPLLIELNGRDEAVSLVIRNAVAAVRDIIRQFSGEFDAAGR